MAAHCGTFCFVYRAVLLSFICILWVLSDTVILDGKGDMVLCARSLRDF